jgi:hypothetical protein
MGKLTDNDRSARINAVSKNLKAGLEGNLGDNYLVIQVGLAQQTILDLNPQLAALTADVIKNAINENSGMSKQQQYQLRANVLLNVFRNMQQENQIEVMK